MAKFKRSILCISVSRDAKFDILFVASDAHLSTLVDIILYVELVVDLELKYLAWGYSPGRELQTTLLVLNGMVTNPLRNQYGVHITLSKDVVSSTGTPTLDTKEGDVSP